MKAVLIYPLKILVYSFQLRVVQNPIVFVVVQHVAGVKIEAVMHENAGTRFRWHQPRHGIRKIRGCHSGLYHAGEKRADGHMVSVHEGMEFLEGGEQLEGGILFGFRGRGNEERCGGNAEKFLERRSFGRALCRDQRPDDDRQRHEVSSISNLTR